MTDPLFPNDQIPLCCIVPITKMSREQWVKYQWHDITTVGDAVRQLVRCHYRTPDEAVQALDDWERLGKLGLLPDIDL